MSISKTISKNSKNDWKQDLGIIKAMHELGHQISNLRMMRGISKKELAERVGTNQSAIARLENGNCSPTLAFLWRIADALDASVKVSFTPKEKSDSI